MTVLKSSGDKNQKHRVDMDERKKFWRAVGEYRRIMKSVTGGSGWMDWISNVYVAGTGTCVRLADNYLGDHSRVLDFGCGMGLVSVLLKEQGHEVVGVDIDIGRQLDVADGTFEASWGSFESEIKNPWLMVNAWKALTSQYGISFMPYDGRSLPFQEGSFDAVIAHAVFEHIKPELLPDILLEIRRVLADSGLLFIFRTPRKDAYLEKLAKILGLATHELLYSEQEVQNIVEKQGFCLVRGYVTDIVPSFPPKGMSVYNIVAPILIGLDKLLIGTPLRKFAHHMGLVFEKCTPDG